MNLADRRTDRVVIKGALKHKFAAYPATQAIAFAFLNRSVDILSEKQREKKTADLPPQKNKRHSLLGLCQ